MAVLDKIRMIIPGQRTDKDFDGEENDETRVRIIQPGAISAGYIDMERSEVAYVTNRRVIERMAYYGKFLHLGDIVMKLSTPYESAVITEACKVESMNPIVSAYCCVLRPHTTVYEQELSSDYLCAVLNSRFVRSQIDHLMEGVKRPILRLNDLKKIDIPVKDRETAQAISDLFQIGADNRRRLQELMETENKILEDILLRGKDVDYEAYYRGVFDRENRK